MMSGWMPDPPERRRVYVADSWLSLVTRLATMTPAELQSYFDAVALGVVEPPDPEALSAARRLCDIEAATMRDIYGLRRWWLMRPPSRLRMRTNRLPGVGPGLPSVRPRRQHGPACSMGHVGERHKTRTSTRGGITPAAPSPQGDLQ